MSRQIAIRISMTALILAGCQTLRRSSGRDRDPNAGRQTATQAKASQAPESLATAGQAAEDKAPEPASSASQPPRLGVLAPFSGAIANHARSYLDGARLALESATSGDSTRDLAIVPADDKGEPAGALLAVRRLDEVEHVTCIVGGFQASATWVAAVEANCRQLPFVVNVVQDGELARAGPYVFHESALPTLAARAAADLVTFELRLFRAAILFPEAGEGRLLASEFSARVAGLGGKVVASESFPPGTNDFSPIVRRLLGAEPDVLFLPIEPETMLLVAPALTVQGTEAQVVGTPAWNSNRFLAQAAADLEGALVPEVETAGADRAALAEFERAYRARHSSAPSRYASAGYLAARRVVDALAAHPGADRQALQSELARRAATRGAKPESCRFLVVRQGALQPFAPQ